MADTLDHLWACWKTDRCRVDLVGDHNLKIGLGLVLSTGTLDLSLLDFQVNVLTLLADGVKIDQH